MFVEHYEEQVLEVSDGDVLVQVGHEEVHRLHCQGVRLQRDGMEQVLCTNRQQSY